MPSRILTFLFLIFLSASTENLFAQSAVIGLEVGDIAPNISMPDTKGEILSLYDLRGEYSIDSLLGSMVPPMQA